MSDENSHDNESLPNAIIQHGKSVEAGLKAIASSLGWIALASVLIALSQCAGK